MSIMARGSIMKKAWVYFLMVFFVSGFSIAPKDQQPEEPQQAPNPKPLLIRLTGVPSWWMCRAQSGRSQWTSWTVRWRLRLAIAYGSN